MLRKGLVVGIVILSLALLVNSVFTNNMPP